MLTTEMRSISEPVQRFIDTEGPIRGVFWYPNLDALVVCLPQKALIYYPDIEVWGAPLDIPGKYLNGTLMKGVLYIATTEGLFTF